MRSGEEEKKKEEEEEKEKSANIKSNNPHLAGGEKHDLYMDQYTLHIPWESKTVYIQSYGYIIYPVLWSTWDMAKKHFF